MLPTLEGVMARRVLLNFRADAEVVQRQLPSPLLVDQRNGAAIVGVCLIRMKQLRPKGFPAPFGSTSENMAHRVGVLYPDDDGRLRHGVFIWRRDTDQVLVRLLGGRLFPGVYHAADFHVSEDSEGMIMDIRSRDGATDIAFAASPTVWHPTKAFHSFESVSEFFRQGDCGFSCARNGELQGMQLHTPRWRMEPLAIEMHRAAFFADRHRFPSGSVEFDCALVMRNLEHEWRRVPQLVRSTHLVPAT